MTRRRQTPEPVPLTPTHRRDWRTFWRRCTCGLTSPCVDRLVPATPRPFPPRTATAIHRSVGSLEERSLRYPTLIEYLATVPFPVHYGVAVLRIYPAEPPDSPQPSLPRATADHPGGSGALGGPGSRPCPGSRAGAAPTPFPHTQTIGHTRLHPKAAGGGRRHDSGVARPGQRCGMATTRQEGSPWHGAGGRRCLSVRTDGGAESRGATAVGPSWRCAASHGVGAVAANHAASAFAPGCAIDAVGAGGGDRAGERVGRPGAGGLRAGSNGGRRGRLPTFGGRPAMAYHHINLSRR